MVLFTKFDINSSFTIFFLILAVLLVLVGVLLARVSPKGRKRGGRHKFDDTIVDRNRELID